MADLSHLERMGRELKCPICLSLLSSSVSLSCNHVFCSACIDKSMKSACSCPVCKVPYHRREVRPAPHMDNLVNIYKSMEVSSGVNIFVTQPKTSEVPEDEDKQLRSTKSKRNRKSKAKGPCKKPSKTENGNESEDQEKPSFPVKKRVQVPKYRPSQHIDDGTNSSHGLESIVLKEMPTMNAEEPNYTPFFWLRDEDYVEKSSQQTDPSQNSDIPPDAPCFSDIKDSDDEAPDKIVPTEEQAITSNAVNYYDSEMFEWTQRPCSPELCSSPVKTQVEDTEEFSEIPETETIVAAKGASTMKNCKQNDNNDIRLSELRKASEEDNVATFSTQETRNAKKGKKNSKNQAAKKEKPRARRSKDEGVEAQVNLEKKASDEDNVVTYSTQETRNAKEEKKISKDQVGRKKKPRALKSKDEGADVQVNLEENTESSTLKEQQTSLMSLDSDGPTPSSIKKVVFGNVEVKQVPETIPALSTDEHDMVLDDLRKNKPASSKHMGKISKERTRKRKDCPSSSNVKTQSNSKYAGEPRLSTKQKTATSAPPRYKDSVGYDASNVISVKDTQPSKGFSKKCKVKDQLTTSVGGLLHKCDSALTKVQCAFCHSSEESEASGEMVHYFNGKSVSADYDGGSKLNHAHRNCTEWAPNVYFDDDNAINLEAELTRSRRIKCCCCGLKGAALGCYETSCKKSFHVPCAKLVPECRWDSDNFVMLCPTHASSKLPNEGDVNRLKRKRSIAKRPPPNQKNENADKDASNMLQKWSTSRSFGNLVLCCSALTIEEKDIVSKFKKLSGTTILKDWDSRVTHVIASTDENGACRRTLKFLMGILEGKWILNIEWIKACMVAKQPVDEQLYEIGVDIHGVREGPRLGRLRVLSKQPKIFDGFKFYLTGDFIPSYKGYLHELVVAAGGAVLNRKPISDNKISPSDGGKGSTFIIYSAELPDKCDSKKGSLVLKHRRSEAEVLAGVSGATVANNSWVLNSIAAGKLQNLEEK